MNRGGHRRRAVLALLVIGLPFLVLLGLTLVLTLQERDLVRTEALEDRQRRVEMLSRRLRDRLDTIRLQVAAGLAPGAELVFVGSAEQNSFAAPWESRSVTRLSPSARSAIEAGRRLELMEDRAAEAVRRYSRALDLARQPGDEAHARMLLGRSLLKTGREKEALGEYEKLSATPPAVLDDQGIPFALYGAERLVALGGSQASALDALHRVLLHPDSLAPSALYLIHATAADLANSPDPQLQDRAGEILSSTASRLGQANQLLELKREIGRILPRDPDGSRPEGWAAFGDPLWLVAMGPARQGEAAFAVSADALQREIRREDPDLGEFELTSGWEHGSEALGAALPGLRVKLGPSPAVPESGRLVASRWFLASSLAAVLAATVAAAWLLWRDVRREVRVTELRAQFVSSVSHELRTPLSAIRMYAESLRMGRPREPEARDEYLDTIINESERLSRLLENVLEFSKIERGERTYRMEPTDLAAVLRSAARALEYALQQRAFRLEVDLEDAMPPVRADADAIEQAVLNLLTNAMKYSGDSRRIELGLEQRNGHAVIRVRDQGIGIDPAEHQQIFERYFRSPGAERTTGAGLGLSIVAHIAEAHGGTVAVTSQPGKGSTFSLALPMEQP